ncbi:hypothetical protein F3Y22_tig00110392pilonHSYRG00060 [Hibiscus syriacus]|uniref:Uncharacterized protein n=1 Tax=Hibiscus syriacus TaxID=106335 RepID=A0A6A3ARR0_HIBSY|nr:hypothetical protein F3Y22_tig00110392pilonHSYRG00060 [Hibiscus syriacus]
MATSEAIGDNSNNNRYPWVIWTIGWVQIQWLRSRRLELIVYCFCNTSVPSHASCWLLHCPAPGSNGAKALVCCSVNCPLPSNAELFHSFSVEEEKHCFSNELEQVIAKGKSYSNKLVPDASQAHFSDAGCEFVLDEALRLVIISESTYRNIILFQREEVKHFKPKTDDEVASRSMCFLMNLILCHICKGKVSTRVSNRGRIFGYFGFTVIAAVAGVIEVVADAIAAVAVKVRTMVDADWLYRAKLSKRPHLDNFESTRLPLTDNMLRLFKALKSLKSTPFAARKSIPVLINDHGRILSIPERIGNLQSEQPAIYCPPRSRLGENLSSLEERFYLWRAPYKRK